MTGRQRTAYCVYWFPRREKSQNETQTTHGMKTAHRWVILEFRFPTFLIGPIQRDGSSWRTSASRYKLVLVANKKLVRKFQAICLQLRFAVDAEVLLDPCERCWIATQLASKKGSGPSPLLKNIRARQGRRQFLPTSSESASKRDCRPIRHQGAVAETCGSGEGHAGPAQLLGLIRASRIQSEIRIRPHIPAAHS